MIAAHSPLRLTLDGDALASNWRWLAKMGGGAACGAAIKSDAYGIGAENTIRILLDAGCRDFFVSTWAEAMPLVPLLGGVSLVVLHGLAEEDVPTALASPARPVLNSAAQVMRWRDQFGSRPCDVMVDTGMNRLGVSAAQIGEGLLDGLTIDTLMSHLACADQNMAMNAQQRDAFIRIAAMVPCKRRSLANSAGICLGPEYAYDLTRPGLALYGGIPRAEAEDNIRQVVHVEAQVVQRRRIDAGAAVGYNATFIADRAHELAILNLGYADGYFRGFSGTGRARIGDVWASVVGRVSMDLIAIAVDDAPHLAEGDWVELDFHLPAASAQSGMSQYELLTSIGSRFSRNWR